jgi:cell division protein FtsB
MNIPLGLITSNFSIIKKIFAALVILLIVLAPFVLLYSSMSNANKENKRLNEMIIELRAENIVLKNNIETLKENIEALQDSNKKNLIVIEKLTIERKETKKILDRLSQNRINDQMSIKLMSDKIKEMLKEAGNDGEVAPVLKETVKNIQESRKK